MEIPQFKSFSQLPAMEDEDSCFNFQWPVTSIDDHFGSMAAVEENTNTHQFQTHTPLFEYFQPVMEPSPRPTKQLKTGDHSLMNQGSLVMPKAEDFVSYMGTNDLTCSNLSSSSQSGNPKYYDFRNDFHGGSGGANITSIKNTTRRVAPYQDHILAERKRREKLSQRFIALSALLPNLKKMDKASVLGDAIEYMKSLKERVKTLEEQTSKRANIESVKFEIANGGGEMSSSDENISCLSEQQFPEIKVRFIGDEVLIRIHCEKKSGVVEKTLAEIEKLHLSVINSTAVIFANSMLHITVIAQMDKDVTMTMKEFVRNLHLGLKQFM
ncbi:hypothetical protein SSX86_009647 [Deinandra increscens subsp. villosa]|uniref:BHLH domain-containing protein n=1 Tax=Deinandra increscens subsp. villosa TaxID=3103831 RepID=A0AAP0DHB2_9ASTR